MVKTTTIEVISKKEFELIRITPQVLEAVKNSGVKNGIVYIITAHTTTGIQSMRALLASRLTSRTNWKSWSPPSLPTTTTTFCPLTVPSDATLPVT